MNLDPSMTYAIGPAPSALLPEGHVLLWNEIRQAFKPHRLDCGCSIPKGVHYHSVGVKAFGQVFYHKRHVWECPFNKQPLSLRNN